MLFCLWQRFFRKNSIDGTRRSTGSTVDTFGRINIEVLYLLKSRLFRGRMNTINRAHIDAGGVFAANAGLGNNVGHDVPFYHYRRLHRSQSSVVTQTRKETARCWAHSMSLHTWFFKKTCFTVESFVSQQGNIYSSLAIVLRYECHVRVSRFLLNGEYVPLFPASLLFHECSSQQMSRHLQREMISHNRKSFSPCNSFRVYHMLLTRILFVGEIG